MRGLRPRDRRRINQVCWIVTSLAAAAGLLLGLSGSTVEERLSDDEFLEPARPYWTSEQLGIVPFALPGVRTAAGHRPPAGVSVACLTVQRAVLGMVCCKCLVNRALSLCRGAHKR